jgi:aspartate 1-decarboxylase
MKRTLLKSKIHQATVTDADLNYVGSVTIDQDLMDAADLVEYEQVQIYDITNGSRLTTYVIVGEAGSGEICINGAAAHLVKPRDLVIIVAYAEYEDEEIPGHKPRVVLVDEQNRIRETSSKITAGAQTNGVAADALRHS